MKRFTRTRRAGTVAVTLGAILAGPAARSGEAEVMTIPELERQAHVHGLAVDRQEPWRVLIATHHGLFRC